MNSQALADRLAELAGWRKDAMGVWDRERRQLNHPFPVGSLDALERWRGELLKGWEWYFIHADAGLDNDWNVCVYRNGGPPYIQRHGPDEWTARAAALIAAKESSK